ESTLGQNQTSLPEPSPQPNPEASPPASPAETGASTQGDSNVPPPPGRNKTRKRTPHGRGTLPEHLPVETLDVTPEEEIAPDSRFIGEEVSYRLVFRFAGYTRLRVVRKKFASDNVDASTRIVIAPMPDEMIPRCMAHSSMLAHTIHSKWGDHIPYTRL